MVCRGLDLAVRVWVGRAARRDVSAARLRRCDVDDLDVNLHIIGYNDIVLLATSL